jgi:hypothetical protein
MSTRHVLLTPADCAKLAHGALTPAAFRAAAARGALRVAATTLSGHRLFSESDVAAYVAAARARRGKS